MKKLLLSFLLLPFLSIAQRFVLIDRDFKKPFVFIDSISSNQIFKNGFPLFYADMDAITKQLKQIIRYMNGEATNQSELKKFPTGSSGVIITTEKRGTYNKYYVTLITKAAGMELFIQLATAHDSKRRALQKLSIVNDYLLNNIAIVKDSVSEK